MRGISPVAIAKVAMRLKQKQTDDEHDE